MYSLESQCTTALDQSIVETHNTVSVFKADMKSYKSLETAAIFYSSESFLKQGIS